jgi:hypothetical protein
LLLTGSQNSPEKSFVNLGRAKNAFHCKNNFGRFVGFQCTNASSDVYVMTGKNDNSKKPVAVHTELTERKLYCLANKLEKIEEELFRLADNMQSRRKWSRGSEAVMLDDLNTGSGCAKDRFRAMEERERNQAAMGVNKVIIDWKADGSADVSIEGYRKFWLPRNLAELLAVLRQDTGCSDDHLVGWKSITELTIHLGKKAGRNYKKHAVAQTVYRLKCAFREAGINPHLVQSNRGKGYRFCQRKAGVITSDWK